MSNTNIVSLYMQGKSKSEIAKELKISRGKVFRELNKESALKIIEKIEGLTIEGITGLQGKVLDNLNSLLESKNETVKLKASMYLLNMFMDRKPSFKNIYSKELFPDILSEKNYNSSFLQEVIKE